MSAIILTRAALVACPKCGDTRCTYRLGRLVEAYRYGHKWMATNTKHVCTNAFQQSIHSRKKVIDFRTPV